MWILLFLLLICSNVFASQVVNVTTGYGYITDNNGHIIGKYSQQNLGPLTISDGYSYTEVRNQADLNTIQLYQSSAASLKP